MLLLVGLLYSVFLAPMAGHCQPMSLPEIPGHSWISLAQSLVGSLLLSPVSCVYKVFFEPSKSLFPQTC